MEACCYPQYRIGSIAEGGVNIHLLHKFELLQRSSTYDPVQHGEQQVWSPHDNPKAQQFCQDPQRICAS